MTAAPSNPAAPSQPSIESASDTEMYALRDLIASHIVCEADCRSMPTGCGCALTAARSIVNSHASLKADLAQCTEANHHYRDAAQRTGGCGEKDYIISQHIGWLKQYVEGMTEANWQDMRLRAERQLSEISRDLDATQPTQGGDKGEAVRWFVIDSMGFEFHFKDERVADLHIEQVGGTKAPLYAAPQPASNAESTISNLRQQITDLQRTVVDTNERYPAIAYAAKEPADAEAVAKAMYDWQFGAGTWDASQSSMKDHYVGLARAAISSLSSTHLSPGAK